MNVINLIELHHLKGEQRELAELIGYSPSYVRAVVGGKLNGIEKVQQGRWKASGIGRYFKGMFVSDSIGIAKPNLGYFEHVFANIPGFEREKALLIGDSLSSDMKGGVNASIDTLWYNPKHQPHPTDMPITYEIDDLRKIKDFLCN